MLRMHINDETFGKFSFVSFHFLSHPLEKVPVVSSSYIPIVKVNTVCACYFNSVSLSFVVVTERYFYFECFSALRDAGWSSQSSSNSP